MTVGPEKPPVAVPRTVDPSRVERELAALWREAAEARGKAKLEGMQNRILLHTLVVYAADASAAQKACQAALALSPRQPARTIVLEALASDAPAGIEATVALNHTPAKSGDESLCGELVTITARGPEAVKRLPGAALPLLLTNLPSFLWWQNGSPFRHPALPALAPVMDRLIVDSLTFGSPDHDLAELDRAISDTHFAPTVSDLVWARLAPWRYHTAQVFDAAATRPYLQRLRTATLRYHAGSPVLAWLFAGWLASRLGWAPIERDAQFIRFEGGQEMRFVPLPAHPELDPGTFSGVSLAADDGSTFDVTRSGVSCTVSAISLGQLEAGRVVPLRAETITEWLGHELSRLAPVPTYEAALRLLSAKSEANADPIG